MAAFIEGYNMPLYYYSRGDEEVVWKKLYDCALEVFNALGKIKFQLTPGFSLEEQKVQNAIIKEHGSRQNKLPTLSLVVFTVSVIGVIKELYSSSYPQTAEEEKATFDSAFEIAKKAHTLFLR